MGNVHFINWSNDCVANINHAKKFDKHAFYLKIFIIKSKSLQYILLYFSTLVNKKLPQFLVLMYNKRYVVSDKVICIRVEEVSKVDNVYMYVKLSILCHAFVQSDWLVYWQTDHGYIVRISFSPVENDILAVVCDIGQWKINLRKFTISDNMPSFCRLLYKDKCAVMCIICAWLHAYLPTRSKT